MVDRIYKYYESLQYPGTVKSSAQYQPAPPPGYPNRAQWKADLAPSGPVSLMLQELHYHVAALDVK